MPPVIVGVGDFKNKAKDPKNDGSDEPAALILKAIDLALSDTGLSDSSRQRLQSSIDGISVVRPWSWPYPDLAGLLASKLSVSPSYLHVSPHGGNQPAKLLDEACRRISLGRSRAAVVTGGEALDSLQRYIKAQSVPPPGWTQLADLESFAEKALRPPSEATLKGVHGVGMPIQVYPLYENGLRAKEGKTFSENNDESAQMYAEFAEVSRNNPHSWNFGRAESKASIGTVGERNRLICSPYPLLMNAFNNINIAGACIVTSSEYAEELGIPKERWIYVLGGAGTAESEEFYMRLDFHSAPAIGQSIDNALRVAGVHRDDVDLYDFYSCFPIVPKLACRHLGLPTSRPGKPITLLGGLTSFGGAGNNYSMHAISAMTRQLREGNGKTGLILANGGVLSYQHAVVLSTRPGRFAYSDQPPLPEHLEQLHDCCFEAAPEGDAVVETYTVEFTRSGKPKRGHVVGRLVGNNHRFIANHADERTLVELAGTVREIIGRKGRVFSSAEKRGQNLFSLTAASKL